MFFVIHDSATLNRQGSELFVSDSVQKQIKTAYEYLERSANKGNGARYHCCSVLVADCL